MSLLLILIQWKSFSRKLEGVNSDLKLLRAIFAGSIDFSCLCLFELFFILNSSIFLVIFYHKSSSFSLGAATWLKIFELAWINLVLVISFQSFLAFQAQRLVEGCSFQQRIALDFAQEFVHIFEAVLLLLPFNLLTNLVDIVSFFFYFGYWISVLILVSEGALEAYKKLKNNSESKKFMIFLEFSILSSVTTAIFLLLPFPLTLVSMIGFEIFLLLLGLIFLAFCLVLLFENLDISISLQNRVQPVYRELDYQLQLLFSSRGALFDYPVPTVPEGDQSPGEPIHGRYGKVTLKIVCGNCFHTFKVILSSKEMPKEHIRCPICHSDATTPVWE